MIPQAEQYPFVMKDPSLGAASLCPPLPVTLQIGQQTASLLGYLDTAAAVNVMPFDMGLQLGAVWEQQTVELPLTGNLAQQEARLLMVSATVGRFPAVSLLFAWTKSSNVPSFSDRQTFSWSSTSVFSVLMPFLKCDPSQGRE